MTDLPYEIEKRATQCVHDAIKALGINLDAIDVENILKGKYDNVDESEFLFIGKYGK